MEDSSYPAPADHEMVIQSKENTPTTIPESSAPSTLRTPGKEQPGWKKSIRIQSFLRRISSECALFFDKLKHHLDLSRSDEELLDTLFESSDDDLFERNPKPKKCCSLTQSESQFINDYNKYNLLEKIFENSPRSKQAQQTSEDSMTLKEGSAINFGPLDMDLEAHTLPDGAENRHEKNDANCARNIGDELWNARRAKWLTPASGSDASERVEQRREMLSLRNVPKTLYPRIYKDFVVKAKPLSRGKAINLEDLIGMIDAGWVNEKRWERAASGLP